MARRKPLPSVDQIVANLTTYRVNATRQNVLDGRAWYGATKAMILKLRDDGAHASGRYDVSDAQAIGYFAAYSQNASWKGNVTMARKHLAGRRRGLPDVLANCAALENGADPTDEAILGLKRAAFCANMLGNEARVTCDRWHLRAAFNSDKYPALDAEVLALVTEATRKVARRYRETPAQCQAVIWCSIRGSGE